MVNRIKYEFLDHTADIKVKISGKDLTEVFENSVLALSEYLSSEKKIESKKVKVINVQGSDTSALLYNFIEEILYLIDSEGFAPARAKVILRGNNLQAEISGDTTLHYHLQQIKAPTYAEMEIKKDQEGWIAQFVLDV
ncbi:MAG: archease [Nanoarchaeota archaeon]|nr:archease [Nanoarchaeota archaeon]